MSDAQVVALVGASKIYGEGVGSVAALKNAYFSVPPGGMVCIAGPSGSGKTTLLNLAGLLDRPTGGEVYVDGTATASLGKRERAELRRDRLGFVFQSASLLPVLTALENVELALELSGKSFADRRVRALTCLEKVGLSGMAGKYPREMSGGQRQRVSVARAIAKDPPLVIADEPTANLDGASATALMELFSEINGENGTAFLFSSHDPRVIGAAKAVVMLVDGSIRD